jgi:hypothetical protein
MAAIKRSTLAALAALVAGAPPAWSAAPASACAANSPAHAVALVELYTSEGCSSCPPADKWLRAMAREGYAAGKVAPLAFHVDYWDYIGWKDPYASSAHSERQRQLARERRATVVYTPQVMLAGADYRRWGSSAFRADVERIHATPARAAIEIALSAQPDGRLEARAKARVPSAPDRAGAKLHLALWQSGLSTRVSAGENRGELLQHDYVVRQWASPQPLAADGAASAQAVITLPGAKPGLAGATAFVQNAAGEVLQAWSLPLCEAGDGRAASR